MSREANKKLIENLHHIWNEADYSMMEEVYSKDVVVHWPRGFLLSESRGIDGVRSTIEGVRSAIPDWTETVYDMIIEGDKVVTRYTSTGVNLGDYAGVKATGKKIELDEISIYRIEEGKVIEQWCLSDDTSMLVTLGLLAESPDL
ncbi:ester cyclase [Dasania marina]|uniref:ester cyclase n=1 Tax=Dasania marina TaxID=471499 RepID=UPI0030D86D1E|tara:strand:- start:74762 stop:75196 length:435 start_codon:yes stop_codon:yes gene_type:complete